MKPYGLKRRANAKYPDKADIQEAGFKSRIGNIRGKKEFCG